MLKRIGGRWVGAVWPWLVLAGLAGVAVWHVVDFSEAADTDFPRVIRPYFSAYPPRAYRLAEPGDTLDRLALYFGAGAVVLAAVGLVDRLRRGQPRLWPAALALSLAATWHASTPGPTYDGWHGLGFRVILDPGTPVAVRAAVAAGALALAAAVVANLARTPARWHSCWAEGRRRGVVGLVAFAAVLVALRQVEPAGAEPAGYWPRCALDLGLLAWGLALIRLRPASEVRSPVRHGAKLAVGWGLVVAVGLGLVMLHRPLSRLRAIVPGKIYMSAMPTYTGLAIEQERLHFRTIINLFDETSEQKSPRHGDEMRFVREHGINYLGSPADGMESDRFLDETIRVAQDPSAWPILVHCHGCMDRTPAWMGIYRFLVEGRPIGEIYREIERHRGTRPKAVVMLQYKRKLPPRAPERWAGDPTAARFPTWINGTPDPYARPGWRGVRPPSQVSARPRPAKGGPVARP